MAAKPLLSSGASDQSEYQTAPATRITHRRSSISSWLNVPSSSVPDDGDDDKALLYVDEARLYHKYKSKQMRRVASQALASSVGASIDTLSHLSDVDHIPTNTTTNRIGAYCTCKEYNMRKLMRIQPSAPHMQNHIRIVGSRIIENVIQIDVESIDETHKGCALVYSFGCVVVWGMRDVHDKAVMRELSAFEIEPNTIAEMDEFRFVMGKETTYKNGVIVVEDGERTPVVRVVAAHTIAQSVKIAHFEQRIEQTIDTVEPLARELETDGRLMSLTRKTIGQRIGTLFLLRSQVNFADISDVPAFLWDLEDLEAVHEDLANYVDIRKRVEMLNNRMDTLGYLYDILRDENNNRHSATLEWIVIVLVAIEVILGLLPYVRELIKAT